MKPFKILLNVILVLILTLSLFGCNKTSSNGDVTQSESTDASTTDSDSTKNEESKNVDSSEYIFPESDTVLLTESKLNDLPIKTLELGRNEIFARHGYVFKTEDLKTYFTKKSWYKTNASFNQQKDLNTTETKNISLIKSVEDKKINKTVTKKVEGKTYGRIKQVSTENGTKYIVFDKVEWLTYEDIKNRQDVKDQLVKDYGSLPTEFDNDYYIYDPDAALTKLQFNGNGTITNWQFGDNGIKLFSISFEDLQSNSNKYDMPPQQGIYCISTENDNIVKLEKMYQP